MATPPCGPGQLGIWVIGSFTVGISVVGEDSEVHDIDLGEEGGGVRRGRRGGEEGRGGGEKEWKIGGGTER